MKRTPPLSKILTTLTRLIALSALVALPSVWSAEPAPQSRSFPNLGVTDLSLKVSPGTRRCCLLGTNLEMLGWIPTRQTIDPSHLKGHHFGGAKDEGNGMVATCSAGFLDVAHIRYAADLTLKLALQIEALGKTGGTISVHPEAGKGSVTIRPATAGKSRQPEDILQLAGSIALDLTTWHEIITWYNFSEVPLYTEKGSAFSPEDPFSNQMGIELGKRAILRSNREKISYDTAMDRELDLLLRDAGVLPEKETIRILDSLEKKTAFPLVEAQQKIEAALAPACASPEQETWFDPQYNIPNYRRLTERNTEVYGKIKPALPPASLFPPECLTNRGEFNRVLSVEQPSLWNDYTLEFRLKNTNRAARKVKNQNGSTLTQEDFPNLIQAVSSQIQQEFPF